MKIQSGAHWNRANQMTNIQRIETIVFSRAEDTDRDTARRGIYAEIEYRQWMSIQPWEVEALLNRVYGQPAKRIFRDTMVARDPWTTTDPIPGVTYEMYGTVFIILQVDDQCSYIDGHDEFIDTELFRAYRASGEIQPVCS